MFRSINSCWRLGSVSLWCSPTTCRSIKNPTATAATFPNTQCRRKHSKQKVRNKRTSIRRQVESGSHKTPKEVYRSRHARGNTDKYRPKIDNKEMDRRGSDRYTVNGQRDSSRKCTNNVWKSTIATTSMGSNSPKKQIRHNHTYYSAHLERQWDQSTMICAPRMPTIWRTVSACTSSKSMHPVMDNDSSKKCCAQCTCHGID